MKVYHDTASLPAFNHAVVTIGTFDGVHLGHRKIINQLKAQAAKINGETVIITFNPHPRKVVSLSSSPIQLLSTLEEKEWLLEDLGIDHLVVVPFTRDFANQTAEEYVEDFLIKKFHPHALIIGYDHRFGKERKGDFHLLETYAGRNAFKLIEISQHLRHESAISSTRIRENLAAGKIKEANDLLGYSYFFEGRVIEGNKLGRTIGFPTANLEVNHADKLIPCDGVYAVKVKIPGILSAETHTASDAKMPEYKGMMNIGLRPTIDGKKRVIEVNLFDFNQDIYQNTLNVSLVEFLRLEKKFESLDALKEQLAADRRNAAAVLS